MGRLRAATALANRQAFYLMGGLIIASILLALLLVVPLLGRAGWPSVAGAAFLTLLPEALRGAGRALGLSPGPLRLFLNGAILLAVILFLPNGIVSLPRTLRERRMRKASRAALG